MRKLMMTNILPQAKQHIVLNVNKEDAKNNMRIGEKDNSQTRSLAPKVFDATATM